MAKTTYNICLHHGVDKQTFIDSFDADTQASLHKRLECLECCISMNIEESFLETFRSDSRVVQVDERLEAFPANIPSIKSQTATLVTEWPDQSVDGRTIGPMQFYYDTDQITPGNAGIGTTGFKYGKLAGDDPGDDEYNIGPVTWNYRWTGKNVDIVTLEVGPTSASYTGDHDTHPDYDNPSNTGNTRVIPMNWPGLEGTDNNQVTSNQVFSSHAMGVLSAAAGTVCGFAKDANLRVAYLGTGGDDTVECINEIVNWHNSKSNNPETGVPNPTIMIGEYQYLQDRKYAVPIDKINQIVTPNGTYDRPGASWGTDFSEFVSKNIIPWKVYNPTTTTYEWCVVFPIQVEYSSLKSALESAWDAGVVCINAAGNNAGVYVKADDPEHNGTYCVLDTPYDRIEMNYGGANTISTSSITPRYTFIAYGPHGVGGGKGIDVAAGYNSEGLPVLDSYTNRGKGIDIIGLGETTWTSEPSYTYADGNKWGMFSGTSCAAPTVVGKAACIMEREFYYGGVWPSPNKVKDLLINHGKKKARSLRSTDWSSVPSATSTTTNNLYVVLVRINNLGYSNGGYHFTELAGTPDVRAFFDPRDFSGAKQEVTKGKRPVDTQGGNFYPRSNVRYGSTNFDSPEIQ